MTPTSRLADLHLSFTPGTDLAILNAMAHVLVAEGLVDEEFVKAHVAFGEGKEPNKTLGGLRGVPRRVHARARRRGLRRPGGGHRHRRPLVRREGPDGDLDVDDGPEPAHEGRLGEQPRPQPPPRHRQDRPPRARRRSRSPASPTPAAACATAARSRTCFPTGASSRTRSTAPRWRSSGTCRPARSGRRTGSRRWTSSRRSRTGSSTPSTS